MLGGVTAREAVVEEVLGEAGEEKLCVEGLCSEEEELVRSVADFRRRCGSVLSWGGLLLA